MTIAAGTYSQTLYIHEKKKKKKKRKTYIIKIKIITLKTCSIDNGH